MARENNLRFRLDGTEYVLRGDKSVEQMQSIVDMVEQKVADIRRIAPAYSTTKTAMLAALQMAEDLVDARADYAALLSEANIGAKYDLFNSNK